MFDIKSDHDNQTWLPSDIQGEIIGSSRLRVVRRELTNNYKYYRAMAIRRLRGDAAAEDVVHAFAVKALERAAQLRDIEAVHGWLRRLFETTLIDHCRRQSNRSHREVAFEIDTHDRPRSALTDTIPDPVRTVTGLLSNIKPEYADVIYRLDLIDQPMQKAAQELRITVNNLTVRAHRARRALRDALATMPLAALPAPPPGRTSRAPSRALAAA